LKLISHRGNLFGPELSLENTQPYVEKAIELGFDVEIDVWYLDSTKSFYLGHDKPENKVSIAWIKNFRSYLWIHCKNNEALFSLYSESYLRYFWHQNDDYTITNTGVFWVYPGKELNSNSVMVLPEKYLDIKMLEINDFKVHGVCSDYVGILESNLSKDN
jgi:hypothetical protein